MAVTKDQWKKLAVDIIKVLLGFLSGILAQSQALLNF